MEKSIVVADWEARAFVEGRKTQIRRLVKPQPYLDCVGIVTHGKEWLQRIPDGDGKVFHLANVTERLKCPFGQPGDRLWVKERWWPLYQEEGQQGVLYEADRALIMPKFWNEGYLKEAANKGKDGFRPAQQMNAWASRITLVVGKVWVHRVQNVSAFECAAEGHDAIYVDEAYCAEWLRKHPRSWERNDWVWAAEVSVEVRNG